MSTNEKNSKKNDFSTIYDIRDVLFGALEKLNNETMDVDRAKAICDISQTLLNSIQIELRFVQKVDDLKKMQTTLKESHQKPIIDITKKASDDTK